MRAGIKRFALAIVLTATAVTAAAQTRYVSDELSINMRRGPGTDYRITKLLEAGTKLEVVQRQDGWTEIRTENGDTGWVLSRFLSDTAAARDRLQAIKQELSQALEGSEELGETKRKLVEENQSLKKELAEIKEASANAVRISEENQRFREKILAMESEMERLKHENESLQSRREGMKIGALVLAIGIIIGLVLPLFRRRPKSTWDSL